MHKKKRKFETGRPPAMTKLGEKRVHLVRARGGNTKFRALRLNEGNFSWGSTGERAEAGLADFMTAPPLPVRWPAPRPSRIHHCPASPNASWTPQ